MKQALCCLLAAVVAVACTDRSTPLIPTSAQSAARQETRTPGGPAGDLVATPNGWYHRDCVHEIPNGAHVDIRGRVTRVDGTSYQIAMCSDSGRVITGTSPSNGPTLSSWIEWAHYAPGTNWGNLNASWHVPAAPESTFTSNPEQVYYSFPGLESSSYIIQPVLTYGYAPDYGGNFWTAASWRCNSGSDCHHGTPISVTTGDSLPGSVSASACANGMCTWTITTVDVTTSARSVWSVDDVSSYFYAVGGAIEVYNLAPCTQLPVYGVFYSGISLYDQNNHQVTPSWADTVQAGANPACGFNASSTASVVNLYHDPAPTVTVSGPQSDTSGAYVTVTATAYGVAPPFGFAWTVNGDPYACGDGVGNGNQNTCSAQLGAAGNNVNFSVIVTDANKLTASGNWAVYTCQPPSAPSRTSFTRQRTQTPPPPICGP